MGCGRAEAGNGSASRFSGVQWRTRVGSGLMDGAEGAIGRGEEGLGRTNLIRRTLMVTRAPILSSLRQRWEAIFWAPAGTQPDRGKLLHAERLLEVDRRVLALRSGQHSELVERLETFSSPRQTFRWRGGRRRLPN